MLLTVFSLSHQYIVDDVCTAPIYCICNHLLVYNCSTRLILYSCDSSTNERELSPTIFLSAESMDVSLCGEKGLYHMMCEILVSWLRWFMLDNLYGKGFEHFSLLVSIQFHDYMRDGLALCAVSSLIITPFTSGPARDFTIIA